MGEIIMSFENEQTTWKKFVAVKNNQVTTNCQPTGGQVNQPMAT